MNKACKDEDACDFPTWCKSDGKCWRGSLAAASGSVVKRDKPWWGYPIGTKAPAINGGHWIKVKGGWKWHNGDIFPTPGADNTGNVILPPNSQLTGGPPSGPT